MEQCTSINENFADGIGNYEYYSYVAVEMCVVVW